jgi:hypothetical protein
MHCYCGADAEKPQITAEDGHRMPHHWVCHVPCKEILCSNQITDFVAESIIRGLDIYLTGLEIICFYRFICYYISSKMFSCTP